MHRLRSCARHVVSTAAPSSAAGPPENWVELVAAGREKGLTAPMIFPWNPAREEMVREALGDDAPAAEDEPALAPNFFHMWQKMPQEELLAMCKVNELPVAGSESVEELIAMLEVCHAYRNRDLAPAGWLPPRDPRFTMEGGNAMVHFPDIVSRATSDAPQIAKMEANESEKNSQTWLEDFATSDVEGRELTCGLFRMNAGEALQYTYT